MWPFIFAMTMASLMLQPSNADADLVFDQEGYNQGRYGPDPYQYYHSTDISSPLLLVNLWDHLKTDNTSHIFLTLDSPAGEDRAGPVIYRAHDLSLVYSEPRWSVVHNAHIGQVDGEDYLVFIEQSRVGNGPSTNCLLYDSTYSLAFNVSARNAGPASMGIHECQLTADGSAVIILTEIIPFDLTAVGGPEDGKVLENIIQEIDVPTGELLWEWRASEHIDLLESYAEYKHGPGAYDYIHMNSAEKTPEGDFLISARHTHSIKLIYRQDGDVIWTLGGKSNDFLDLSSGAATDFAWQHHARLHYTPTSTQTHTQLTLFDNHDTNITTGCATNCSRGKHVELGLDPSNLTARLLSESYHPQGLISGYEGSSQLLPAGNAFLGWGANPTFTEHLPSGECVLDVQFDTWRPDKGYPVNYRAFKMNWTAFPVWDPEIAVRRTGRNGSFKVYVSWNGATEVAEWELLVGNSADYVSESAVIAVRGGFETEIQLESDSLFVRAVAFDKDCLVLGRTAIVPMVGES